LVSLMYRVIQFYVSTNGCLVSGTVPPI
jgi:hypothetical protein